MKKSFIIAGVISLALATTLFAMGTSTPMHDDYKKVSDLVPLPDFIPGMGTLYVQPATLPVGPFLAYNRDKKLVATIYMVPLAAMQQQKAFKTLAVGTKKVETVDFYYNAGHPGVSEPHYHVTLWHVKPEMAKVSG